MDARPERPPAPLGQRVGRLAAVRYVIVFAIRSGSTLLCEDLAQAGLGAPTEHFQGPLVVPPAGAYVERLVAADAPVFGTKISWEQSFALLRRLANDGEIRSFDLRDVFGDDVKVIHLVRKNKLRQAVSAWRAASSGVWHNPPGTCPDGRKPDYDREAIVTLMMQLLVEDWLWDRHVADAGIEAVTLAYEDYVADRPGWLTAIARHVGRPLDRIPNLLDRIQPMADAWTDELEQRLLDDLSAPVHPFWAAPELWGSVPASLPIEACVPLPRPGRADPEGAVPGPAG